MPKLDKKFVEKCKVCHHGKAAHPGNGGQTWGDGPCRMKHCKCPKFQSQ